MIPAQGEDDRTPQQRFADLARRLLAVPKSELNHRAAKKPTRKAKSKR